MEIVVSLDDSVYKHIIEHSQSKRDFICASDCVEIFESIKNGTPLPKGHGRIVDESSITSCEWDGESETMITNAPTIIEADKAETENP